MCDAFRRTLGTAVVLACAAGAGAQPAPARHDASTTYRVFLTTGEPLPIYGEPVFVDGRVIFNLLVDPAGDVSALQLVSLPLAGIDGQRTSRYTEAMRAAHYARTRGEADYVALTSEVGRVLNELRTIRDPRERLVLAERARRQLVSWPLEHFQYRVDEIRSLVLLVDGVIADLRAAVGERGVTLDLIAGQPPLEPVMRAPTLREAIALALRTAELADNGAERLAILRRAAGASARLGDPAVTRTVEETLAGEERVDAEYAALMARLRAAADQARARGDVAALDDALRELDAEDARLGLRRPVDVQASRAYLEASLETARVHRAAVQRYDEQISARRRYANRLRPLLARVERHGATLSALRQRRGIAPARIAAFESALGSTLRDLARVDPPEAQADVQVVFRNALLFAQQAAVRRRQARSTQAAEMAESSSAAAGALILLQQVREGLEASLRRPAIR